jgi:hypothetical protein
MIKYVNYKDNKLPVIYEGTGYIPMKDSKHDWHIVSVIEGLLNVPQDSYVKGLVLS